MRTKKINSQRHALQVMQTNVLSNCSANEVLNNISSVRQHINNFKFANVVAIEFDFDRDAHYGTPQEQCRFMFELPPAPEWRNEHIENVSRSAFKRQTPWQRKLNDASYRLHIDLNTKRDADTLVQLLNMQITTFNKFNADVEKPAAAQIITRHFHKCVAAIKRLVPEYWIAHGVWSFPKKYRKKRAISAQSYIYVNNQISADDKVTNKQYAADIAALVDDIEEEEPEAIRGTLKIYCDPFAVHWCEDVEVKITKHNNYVFQD